MSTLVFDSKKLESEVKNGVLVMKYTDKDAYLNGTDIKKATIKEVETYNKEYKEKASEFIAKEALKALEKDKKIDVVKVELPYQSNSYGKLTGTINREKTYPGINGRPDVTKSTFQLKVKEATNPGKSFISKLEEELTRKLVK